MRQVSMNIKSLRTQIILRSQKYFYLTLLPWDAEQQFDMITYDTSTPSSDLRQSSERGEDARTWCSLSKVKKRNVFISSLFSLKLCCWEAETGRVQFMISHSWFDARILTSLRKYPFFNVNDPSTCHETFFVNEKIFLRRSNNEGGSELRLAVSKKAFGSKIRLAF